MACKRWSTRQCVVKGGTEAVYVGPVGDAVRIFCLLGSHVMRRSHPIPRSRQVVSSFRATSEPEIGNACVAKGIDQNVRRLQVTMNDTFFRGCRHSLAHLSHPRQCNL